MTFHFFNSRSGLWLASLLVTASALATPSPLEEARTALDEGVAEVAIVKLQQYLAADPVDAQSRREAKTKLAEALLAAGRTEEALNRVREIILNRTSAINAPARSPVCARP